MNEPDNSRKRHLRLPQRRRTAEQKPLCRWCGKAVPAGRREWCSEECIDDYKVRSGSSVWVREVVFRRDRGICALCQTDTPKLRERLQTLLKRARRIGRHASSEGRLRRWAAGRGFDRCRSSWWDADHILPVVRGGGACGLENYRTLCQPCHKRETARLAALRATERAEARTLADPQMSLCLADQNIYDQPSSNQ
jgi:5-methylcytosine-specific restriction endonuclease McrA